LGEEKREAEAGFAEVARTQRAQVCCSSEKRVAFEYSKRERVRVVERERGGSCRHRKSLRSQSDRQGKKAGLPIIRGKGEVDWFSSSAEGEGGNIR